MKILVLILSYLLGSIPSGLIVGHFAGVDVRTAGSGNIGATNVTRILGKGRGLLTLFADAAKGFLPVFVALQLGFDAATTAGVGAAAFLGHLFPVYLKFRGGKGVATAMGAMLGMAPLATLALMVVFGGAVLISRMVSVGSLAAAVAAPLVLWSLSYPPAVVGMGGFLGVMVILRHRANLQRLRSGTEPRFDAH